MTLKCKIKKIQKVSKLHLTTLQKSENWVTFDPIQMHIAIYTIYCKQK